MLKHHAEVYRKLQDQFPDADVYIGTSDKVELPKSPFNFRQKQLIAKAHGIDPRKVLQAKRPYHPDDYSFDPENTVIIFAVGEKDLDRFPFDNVDASTGLDMTKRGEPKPKYFQKISTMSKGVKPMSQRGYITLAPTVMTGNEVASASAFRKSLSDAPDIEAAKDLFVDQFGEYNDKVFDLIYNKINGVTMNEQINEMRKLAGLAPLMEAAPVDYYGMSDKEKMLADIGRLLMQAAESEKNDDLSNRMAELGGSLADGTVSTQEDLVNFIRGVDASIAGELSNAVKNAMSDYASGQRAGGSDEEPSGDFGDDDEFEVGDDTEVPELEPEDDEVMDSIDLSYISDGYELAEEEDLEEKSVSKAQQQAAGAALAAKRGDIPKSELKGASKEMYDMSTSDLEDFAGTKHKGLPKKKSEAVEETAEKAVSASIAELRKLAGL